MAVLHAPGAGAVALAASQETVQEHLGFAAPGPSIQHLLDQVDAPSRAVERIAEQLVGGAGGAAKAAVHALAQYGFGFQAVGTVAVFGGEAGLHGGGQRWATTRGGGRAYQSRTMRPGLKMPDGSNLCFSRAWICSSAVDGQSNWPLAPWPLAPDRSALAAMKMLAF